jgi:hypothetical protein
VTQIWGKIFQDHKILLLFYLFLDIYKKLNFFNASVAQTAEQLICNQWVGGSIPFAGSRDVYGEVPERSKGADCKSAGSAFGGSNPPLSIQAIPGHVSVQPQSHQDTKVYNKETYTWLFLIGRNTEKAGIDG